MINVMLFMCKYPDVALQRATSVELDTLVQIFFTVT